MLHSLICDRVHGSGARERLPVHAEHSSGAARLAHARILNGRSPDVMELAERERGLAYRSVWA
jgi:hypothetical protein